MLTKTQTERIARLVSQLIAAELADSWKGGGDPADIPLIEQDLLQARQRLAAYLVQLQDGKEPDA